MAIRACPSVRVSRSAGLASDSSRGLERAKVSGHVFHDCFGEAARNRRHTDQHGGSHRRTISAKVIPCPFPSYFQVLLSASGRAYATW